MKYALLLSALFLSGCAAWIPIDSHQQNDDSYQLSTTGNSFAPINKMQVKLEKKANSICNKSGFEYIKKPSITVKTQKNYSTGLDTSHKMMNITVKCLTKL